MESEKSIPVASTHSSKEAMVGAALDALLPGWKKEEEGLKLGWTKPSVPAVVARKRRT